RRALGDGVQPGGCRLLGQQIVGYVQLCRQRDPVGLRAIAAGQFGAATRAIHDFIAFDAGAKKICRSNHCFAVRAAQEYIRLRKGGSIWHAQGSGKSLTMGWLAHWIREHAPGVGARSVLRLLVLLHRFYALPRAQGTAKQHVAFLGLDPVPHRSGS
ncbi:MAG: hypothetical protein WHS90_08765, partial [Caldilinea sp.]|uniref:hypothetical protein n=1 Tax=Caldilinea sp. TaxID=2293560 RepID=UPI003097242B